MKKEYKILHCSDIHLDMPFTSMSKGIGAGAEERRKDIRTVFGRIIDTSVKENCDAVVICGDLYEHGYTGLSTIRFLDNLFTSTKEIKYVIIPGNHDPYTVDSFYRTWSFSRNVMILSPDNPYYLDTEKGALFLGLFDGREGILKAGNYLEAINAESIKYKVLLSHCTLEMPDFKDIYNPVGMEELLSLNMDYYALGHFHNKIEGPDEEMRIWNPGSPEPLGFDEPGTHGVYIAGLRKFQEKQQAGVEVEFRALSDRYYRSLKLEGSNNIDNYIDKNALKNAVSSTNLPSRNGLFRIFLHGYCEDTTPPDIKALFDSIEEEVYYLQIIDNLIYKANFEVKASEPGLKGLFVKKMLDRISNEADKDKKAILNKSLNIGLSVLEGEKA